MSALENGVLDPMDFDTFTVEITIKDGIWEDQEFHHQQVMTRESIEMGDSYQVVRDATERALHNTVRQYVRGDRNG